MYYLNEFLFDNLPTLLGMRQMDISMDIYGNDYMYARRIQKKENILFQDIIDICNKYRISIARFVTSEKEPSCTLNRYKYVIPSDQFIPLNFHPEKISRLYGKEGLLYNTKKEAVAKTINVSKGTLTLWANPNGSKIPLLKLLELCNAYGIDLKEFVSDSNERIDGIEVPVENMIHISDSVPFNVWKDISDLKSAIIEDRERIKKLTEENERLRQSVRTDSILSDEGNVYEGYRGTAKIRKWVVNWDLLENLHRMAGVTQTEFIKSAGLKTHSLSFSRMNIYVRSLISICNHYHISTRHFLVRENDMLGELKPYSYYVDKEWKEIKFHPEFVTDLFGDGGMTGMNQGELSESGYISEWKFRSWRKSGRSTMRLSDLVDLCNTFDLTPSCFIEDKNRTELSYNVTYTEMLLEENRSLRQQILRLKEKLKAKEKKSADKGVVSSSGE